jgi:hypothetical protein
MGKFLVGMIVVVAAVAGAAMYYLQVYAYYEEVLPTGIDDVQLVSFVSNLPEPIVYEDFRAIDGDSSPIKYYACFNTSFSHSMLTETYVGLDNVVPRNAPGWFDCFNAAEIAAELEAGTALAFLGGKNIDFDVDRIGVDRIVVITEDGRGYAWHDLNGCGDKAYDGTITGEKCPAAPDP